MKITAYAAPILFTLLTACAAPAQHVVQEIDLRMTNGASIYLEGDPETSLDTRIDALEAGVAATGVTLTDTRGHTNSVLVAREYYNTNNAGSLGLALGGYSNVAATANDFIGGGVGNYAFNGAIAGGYSNRVDSSADSIIGGGEFNSIEANWGSILGGSHNEIRGDTDGDGDGYQTIGGGRGNINAADYSTISGGRSCYIAPLGDYGWAGGRWAQVTNQGSFVWSDSQNETFGAAFNNTFNIRAAGGVYLGAGGTYVGAKVLQGNTHYGDGSGLTNLPLSSLAYSLAAFQAWSTNVSVFVLPAPANTAAAGAVGQWSASTTNLYFYVPGTGWITVGGRTF